MMPFVTIRVPTHGPLDPDDILLQAYHERHRKLCGERAEASIVNIQNHPKCPAELKARRLGVCACLDAVIEDSYGLAQFEMALESNPR